MNTIKGLNALKDLPASEFDAAIGDVLGAKMKRDLAPLEQVAKSESKPQQESAPKPSRAKAEKKAQ